jgi:hypothetical protein
MKYFFISLVAVAPLLTGCTIVEEEHYGPQYYNNPPPVIEVHPQPRYIPDWHAHERHDVERHEHSHGHGHGGYEQQHIHR